MLDPKAPAVLKTYLSFYGPAKTAALIALFLLVAGAAAYVVGVLPLLVGFLVAVLLVLPIMFVAPQKHRVIEGVAVLAGFVAMWSVAIQTWTGWPR